MFPSEKVQGLPDFRIARTFQFRDECYQVTYGRICPPRSLTFNVNSSTFYCDFHDIDAVPRACRPHMYVQCHDNPDFPTKLCRMETWQTSLLFFDSLMVDLRRGCSAEEAMKEFNQFHMPRPDIAELDTSTPGLQLLFTELKYGISNNSSHPFVPSWNQLVDDAASGRIVSTWRALKKR